MLDNGLQDFTKTEIAKGAGLSWASLFSHWNDMERKRIVKLTRTVGRAKLYQLNEKSPLVIYFKCVGESRIQKVWVVDSFEFLAVFCLQVVV